MEITLPDTILVIVEPLHPPEDVQDNAENSKDDGGANECLWGNEIEPRCKHSHFKAIGLKRAIIITLNMLKVMQH